MSLQSLILDEKKPYLNARVNNITIDGDIISDKYPSITVSDIAGTLTGNNNGSAPFTGKVYEYSNGMVKVVFDFATITGSTTSTNFVVNVASGNIPTTGLDGASTFALFKTSPSTFIEGYLTADNTELIFWSSSAINGTTVLFGTELTYQLP